MTVELYRYVQENVGLDPWELQYANVTAELYDDADDDTTQQWRLRIVPGGIDAVAGNNLAYVADTVGLQVTFHANDSWWALRFTERTRFEAFLLELVNRVAGENFANIEALPGAPAGMDEEPEAGLPGPVAPGDLDAEVALVTQGAPIVGLAMGGGEKSYVLRSGRIHVLQNLDGRVEDGNVSFALAPEEDWASVKAMLSNSETKLNILTPGSTVRNSPLLHHADIETNQIVNTYRFPGDDVVDLGVLELSPVTKSAQLEETNQFFALANNTLCRCDLRVPNAVVQAAPVHYVRNHTYRTGPDFTCIATSGAGYVVVGSGNGDIRLYNSNPTFARANHHHRGLGAAITAIDVTYDGNWVVATTDTYLLVFRTIFRRGGVEINYFSQRVDERLTPRVLPLRPQDNYVTGNMPLKNGKLSWITEEGHQERWIVASCGVFTIIWNFRRVKLDAGAVIGLGGYPVFTEYRMQRRSEDIVQSTFMNHRFTNNAPLSALVVATPHRVFSVASEGNA